MAISMPDSMAKAFSRTCHSSLNIFRLRFSKVPSEDDDERTGTHNEQCYHEDGDARFQPDQHVVVKEKEA